MSSYFLPDDLEWETVHVRGTPMQKAVVFEGGFDLRSAYFRMPAGCAIPDHGHSKWVQVTVLDGLMRVEQDGEPVREVRPGGTYFISPGEQHAETAVTETLVLVTQGEDRF